MKTAVNTKHLRFPLKHYHYHGYHCRHCRWLAGWLLKLMALHTAKNKLSNDLKQTEKISQCFFSMQ